MTRDRCVFTRTAHNDPSIPYFFFFLHIYFYSILYVRTHTHHTPFLSTNLLTHRGDSVSPVSQAHRRVHILYEYTAHPRPNAKFAITREILIFSFSFLISYSSQPLPTPPQRCPAISTTAIAPGPIMCSSLQLRKVCRITMRRRRS